MSYFYTHLTRSQHIQAKGCRQITSKFLQPVFGSLGVGSGPKNALLYQRVELCALMPTTRRPNYFHIPVSGDQCALIRLSDEISISLLCKRNEEEERLRKSPLCSWRRRSYFRERKADKGAKGFKHVEGVAGLTSRASACWV